MDILEASQFLAELIAEDLKYSFYEDKKSAKRVAEAMRRVTGKPWTVSKGMTKGRFVIILP